MANKIPLAIADVELQLSTAVSVGSTSFSLSSANDDDGNALPAGKYCFTVDNGNSNKEYLLGQLNGTEVTSVVSVSRQGVETSGAARAHRVGASAIVTDFATIQRVADILRGQETLDAANPIAYDAEPTLTDPEQLATVAYVLSVVNGGTVAFDNQIITGVNAGETVVAGDRVYLDVADQEWKKTDADTAATIEGVELGIALGAGSDGVTITGGVQRSGVYTTTSLVAGSVYYYSNTAGGISTSAGTVKRVAGIALSTTRFLMAPTSSQNLTTRQKDALAGTSGTPSDDNKFVTDSDTRLGVKTMTAGATINGATLPVPVYQNDSDNEFYACDANDTAAMKFLGFAVSNGTDGTDLDVRFNGIVGGFTGLSEGEKYYVQDTVGTIGTTAGTNEVLVGVAISQTELLIQKGRRYAHGVVAQSDSGTGPFTTALVTGFRPSIIRVHAYTKDKSSSNYIAHSDGSWVNGTYACVYAVGNGTTTQIGSTTSYIVRVVALSASDGWEGTITNVTDTGFTISLLDDGSEQAIYLHWEAEGEL